MLLWCLLVLLALPNPTVSPSPGAEDKSTQKVNYGRQIGIAYLQEKLKSVSIPDTSGSQEVSPIGNIEYRLSGMNITDLGLPQSSLGLGLGTGISLSSGNAFISLHGDWHVKYLRFIQDSGSFDLALSGQINITIIQDSIKDCTASLSDFSIDICGGASWLYNRISWFFHERLRRYLENQICPLAHGATSNLLTGSSDNSTIIVLVVVLVALLLLPALICLFLVCRSRSGYKRM